MADIELDNIGEDRTEQEQVKRAEEEDEWEEEEEEAAETSFIENVDNNEDHDDSDLVIDNTNPSDIPSLPNVGNYKRSITRAKKEFLEKELGVILNKGAGPKSKELFDNLRLTLDSKGKRINGAESYDGKKILVLRNGKIEHSLNRAYVNDIIDFKKLLEKAKEEYNTSVASVIDESVDTSMSDEAVESVQNIVIEELESFIDERYKELSIDDPDKNIKREINGITHVDDNIDYDDLSDPDQRAQYDAKIAGLKVNIGHWKYLEQREQDPTKKQLYKTAKELCITKKSYMEVKAGFRPESEEALSMIQEEAKTNDLTRFERFKKWAKENIAGVSAVAISIAGIITTIVIAGRNAVKKGAKAVGQFGKALANIAKKAAPAIATILNILAQVLTWGSKALEFLSRNLWIVALALTYFLYNEVKDRRRKK